MDILQLLQDYAIQGYGSVSGWCSSNQLEAGMIVGVAVFGSLSYLLNRKAGKRKHLHRMLWGAKMRRSRNRLAFERSGIAMAIEDHLFEQEYDGTMTKKSADEWRHVFANAHQMDELLPRKDKETIKRSIRNRLSKGVHRVKAIIPGGPPSVKVDKSYVPKTDEVVSVMKSKFA